MNAAICAGAFALGLVIVAWVGAGYFAASALALAITALIGAVYLAGGLELLRFRRDSRALEAALGAPPVDDAALDPWLARLPASLRQPVRLRIEGERLALPGPVLTPYLVGLLVLLGMLGTFLGLVLTLDGTVAALEGMTDLDAIRSALASPVKGLAFAFGTSVAGVAASAMLGLVSTLCRRERLGVGQLLDAQIGAALRRFSRAHQREQALDALRAQAVAMPALIDAVSAAMAQVQAREAEAAERHRQFLDQTREQQLRLVDELRDGHAQLAGSVASALSESLARSARLAGTEIRSGVESAMAAIAAESQAMQHRVAASMAQQLEALNAGFEQRSAALHDRIDRQLATALGQLSARIDGTAERLLADLGAGAAGIQASAAASEEARQAALVATLSGIAASLREDWRALAERSQAEAARTIGEVGRLMAVAAQAPEAAAEGRARPQPAPGAAPADTSKIPWLNKSGWSHLAVLMVNVWLAFPFMLTVTLGALQSVPSDVYEAASVDGASPRVQFTRITLPLLRSALLPVLISSFAFNFNQFTAIYLLTQGGPVVPGSEAGATDILITYSYKLAFDLYQYGIACAYAIIIFIVVAGVSGINIKMTGAFDND